MILIEIMIKVVGLDRHYICCWNRPIFVNKTLNLFRLRTDLSLLGKPFQICDPMDLRPKASVKRN